MLHPDLGICLQDFFAQFLAGIDAGARPAAETALAAIPVSVGDYVRNATDPRATERLGAVTLTPEFFVSVGRAAVTATGTGAARTFTPPADLGANPRKQTLVLLRERIDIAKDDRATMERVMADFADGAQWAEKLAALPTRSALAAPLAQLTAAPPGLPSSDLEDVKAVLSHFFTYKADGTYYAKYTQDPPAGQFPTHVTDAYIQENFLETQLQQGRMYIYAVLPESVWRGTAAQAGLYRECVFRLDDQGQGQTPRYAMSLLHTAGLYLNPATPATADAPKEQIVAFFSTQGTGLAVAPSGYQALSGGAASLVHSAGVSLDALRAALGADYVALVGTEQNPVAVLMGRVTADFPRTPLPAGVEVSGEGPSRSFRCPLDQVVALAERPDVLDLEPSGFSRAAMDQAAPLVHLPDFYTHLGVAAANAGTGALVGIVDTGVDGGHVAFQRTILGVPVSRIVAAWIQGMTVAGQSPLARRSGGTVAVRTAYQGMNYGVERERSVATDNMLQMHGGGSHGTHVAGIAAGSAFTTPSGVVWPGGVAPGAELVVVAVGHPTGGLTAEVYDGIRYCFQKASELGKPIVVNVSLRTHRHAHDGTDPLSTGVNGLVQELTPPVFDPLYTWQEQGQFKPGRIVCAAAGNERGESLHVHAEVMPGERVRLPFTPQFAADGATIWAYSKNGSDARIDVRVETGSRTAGTFARTPVIAPQPTHAPVSTTIAAYTTRVDVHNGPIRPSNGHRNVEVFWNPTGTTAFNVREWRIDLRNRGTSTIVVDAWGVFHGGSPRFSGTRVSDTRLVGSPAAAVGAIAVASFVSRTSGTPPVGDLSSFSSPGPLRANSTRQALDVTAPGDVIMSTVPRSTTGGVSDIGGMSGTSMASPYVAGTVACMLAKTPSLNHAQVRERLRNACDAPNDRPNDWGAGKLNTSRITV